MKQYSDDVFVIINIGSYKSELFPCRNAALGGLIKGGAAPKPLKTGTTIAGVVFKASTRLH